MGTVKKNTGNKKLVKKATPAVNNDLDKYQNHTVILKKIAQAIKIAGGN
jgi:hypothetical protein